MNSLEQKITDLEKKNTELQLSEARLWGFLEGAPDAIIIIGSDGNINFANVKMEEVFGYSRGELIGNSMEILVPERFRAVHAGHMKSFVPHPKARAMGTAVHLYALRKNGEEFAADIMLSAFNIRGEFSVLAMIRDISEVKRTEEKLKQSEEKYRLLFEESKDTVFITRPDGRFIDINSAGVAILGYASKEELFSKNIRTEVFDNPADRDRYLGILHAQGYVKDYELVLKKKNGEKITVLETSNVVRDERGTIISYRGIYRNITEKKKLESQLLRSQRLESIGTLASGIAHDLNNVLGPITLAVELLQQRATDPLSKTMLGMLDKSAKRGANIVKQVLTFGRGVEGDRVPLQLKHIIKEVESIINETFPKSIRLNIDVREELQLVTGDATQLHQVLLNICVNARDAMPVRGIISIRAENKKLDYPLPDLNFDAKPGSYVQITIHDNGMGIPKGVIDKIFDPFFTTKEIGKGTGLGLSSALGIVKNHGGFINVYSEPGVGTQFKVYLPSSESRATESISGEPAESPRGNNEMILFVDDEPAIIEVARITLEAHGYKVLSAKNGMEATSLYSKNIGTIDLVVSDLMMPLLDGSMMARAIRKINPDQKIIMCSGLNENLETIDSASLHIQGIIIKPFTANKLLTTVYNVLHSSG